jgi:hypothetical protein
MEFNLTSSSSPSVLSRYEAFLARSQRANQTLFESKLRQGSVVAATKAATETLERIKREKSLARERARQEARISL